MLNLNPTTFAAVVDKARTDAAEHPRWLAAIDRAVVELVQNPWIERGELHGVMIASPSGNLYSANGTAPPLGWCACTTNTRQRLRLCPLRRSMTTRRPALRWMSCSPNQHVAGGLAELGRL